MPLQWSTNRNPGGEVEVILENDFLRFTFLPELGGKLWSIVDLARDEEILWHHPTLSPQAVSPGGGYDDAFAGGWDELFPSDRAVEIDGVNYPDHGEWWSQPWAWQVAEEDGGLRLTLNGRGFSTVHSAERSVLLPANRSGFTWQTRVTNTGSRPIPYIWRHHPALPIRPGSRLELPAATVDAAGETEGALSAAPFTWPHAVLDDGSSRDLSALPSPDSGEVWTLYARDLPEGFARVTWPRSGAGDGHGIAFAFDPALVTAVTTFATCGGWRNLQTVLPEVGVGFPANLRDAVDAGTSGMLLVGETVEFLVTVTIW